MKRIVLLPSLALLSLLTLPTLVIAFAACGREQEPAVPLPAPSSGGMAVVGTLVDVQGFNELLAADSKFTSDILDQLFLRLFEEQPDYAEHPPTFKPQLAAGYEFSTDRLQLTVRLRPEAVWSDGAPITAEDVRWSWQAQTDPEVAWSYALAKEAIADVAVVDAHTVRFHFRRAYPTQLLDVNEGYILPRHLWGALPFKEWRQRGDWFREHLVASGPFLLEAWRPAQEIILRRNERYLVPGLPRLDRVVFRIVPDQVSQAAQLLSGALDFVDGVPPDHARRVADSSTARLLTFWHRQYDYVCWNTRRPLFADPEVRRALTLAIDRQSLIDTLWQGFARPSVGPVLSSIWAFNRNLKPWPYDPEESRRVLAAKGWRDTDGDRILERDGQRFSFELTTNSGNQLRSDAAVMIQEQLGRVGIEARLRPLELNTLIERNLAHDFDATLGAWAIDTSLDLSFAFHSSEIENGYNFGSYANPELDRLLEQARTTLDPAAAKPLFDRMQEILHQEQPYTFLWEPMRLCGTSRRLQGTAPNPLTSFFHLAEWWLAPAGA